MNLLLSTKIPLHAFLITVGLAAPAMAQLKSFSNGTVANATDVNGNFAFLLGQLTPLQTSVTGLTGAISVTANGNVGIGTPTPRTLLEVAGDLTAPRR